MRVLFDNGAPRGVASALSEHIVVEARTHGWDTLRNGELLDAAENAGYEVFVTTDRNLRYQQNLTGRRIAIIVLGVGRWRLIRNKLTEIAAAVSAAAPGSSTEIEIPTNLPERR
jgi:predicted nuclease of predicted toxin-antitoxin system